MNTSWMTSVRSWKMTDPTKPFQVLCTSCSSKKLQLLFIELETLSLVCSNCGQLINYQLSIPQKEIKPKSEDRSYLG